MRRPPSTHHRAALFLTVSAVVALLVVNLPHEHGKASDSSQTAHCRACQILRGFSATPTDPPSVHAPLVSVTVEIPRLIDLPRAVLVARLNSPRAPPVLS